jgi:hypothetical protein
LRAAALSAKTPKKVVQLVQPVQNAPLKQHKKSCLQKDFVRPQAAVEILMYKDACNIF